MTSQERAGANLSLKDIGDEMLALGKELWPINRSIMGDGIRETLLILKRELPELILREVSSGTKVFDWTIPDEWAIEEAYILTPSGERICDFQENNLNVVGYSTPVDKLIDLKELQEHLHSLPEQPDAVPYVTSYYKDQWGFCLSHEQRQRLDGGLYRVVIRSKKKPGKLTYGELLIAGRSRNEIFLSTYACHPSMANNELSGPLVFTALAKWLLQRNSYYSYRLFIGPETIGSLTYLSLNLKRMQRRVIAGYVLTCVGDDRQFSYLRSREGGTLSDLAAFAAFAELQLQPKIYDWLDRGSDERQYCSPGIDLPIGSIMRSKYGEFPEYHTNLDRFDSVVTSEGLAGAYKVYRKALEIIENLYYPVAKVKGEPQLSRYGLYASISTKLNYAEKERKSSKLFQNILTYCDGLHSSLEISNLISVSVDEINVALGILEDKGLVKLYRRAKSRL